MASVSQPLSSRDRPPRSPSLNTSTPKHRCPAQGAWLLAAASYLHLQLLLVPLPVEQKAKGEVCYTGLNPGPGSWQDWNGQQR